MARGEVKYRLTLDSDLKQKTEEGAKGLNNLGGTFTSTSDKAGKFANSVSQVSTTLARSATAFGLPAEALRTLDDVADVAGVGLENLTGKTVGFNAASVGAAGAGLAVGTAIGTWLNTFPEVRAAVDALRDSLISLVAADPSDAMARAMHGMSAFQKQMAESNAQAFETVKNRLLAQGKTVEEIAALYNSKLSPAIKTSAQMATELADKHKAAIEANKKHEAELERAHEMMKKASAETVKFWQEWSQKGQDALTDLTKTSTQAVRQIVADQMEILKLRDMVNLAMAGGVTFLPGGLFGKDEVIEQMRANEAAIQEVTKATFDWGTAVDDVSTALRMMGLGKIADEIDEISNSFLKGAQIGAQFGGMGGLIGGGIGALLGLGGELFGGGEEAQINPLRQQFIDAAGGLDALNKKAHEAGLTLDHLLRADSVKEYEAAIRELTGAFDLQTQAQSELDAAAERYGFTTQHQLDMMAGPLLRSWELLNAAGFDNTEITRQMSSDLNDYFQKSIAAGQQIPENFKPIAEQMLKLGLLTNASGEAVQSLEEAGITGFGSMTESVRTLVEEIRKLVAALRGVPDELPNIGGGGGGSVHGGPHGEEGFAEGSGGFLNFGSGTPTTLHGPEMVATPGDLKSVARMMAGYSGGGCNGHDIVLDGIKLGRIMAHRMETGYVSVKSELRG